MLQMLRAAALAVAVTATVVQAADMITCSASSPCPESAPCCSTYGYCGVGAYCLGGCDPKHSFDLQSCVAAPTCQSQDYTFNNLNGIQPNTKYLGDASQASWVSSGMPVAYNNEAVLLTMAPETVGTLLASTHYVWYGKISATMTTSQGAGVVTAFILMSDVKDEIDFEWVGTDVQTAQSNYYWQGVTDYTNAKNLSASNTESTVHTYTIDWQPDYVTWLIDGKAQRTVFRNETYNSTTGQYHYPQTPSRIMLSLWPAGLPTNGQGTIDWAGGEISWNSPYMQNGYYYAMVKDVTVECYKPPSGYQNYGNKAYYYTTTAATNDTVAIGNNNTVLASFLATGDKPNFDPNGSKSASASASGTRTASASASASANTNPETIPGVSGAGGRGDDAANANADANASGSGSSPDAAATDSANPNTYGSSSFSQGSASSVVGGTNDGARVVAGSLVALVAFFAAAMLL